MVTKASPYDLELVMNALRSIADEMAITVVRTAYTAAMKYHMDFSTGICDGKGRVIAQGLTNPLHMGSFPEAAQAVLKRHGDNLTPGDVIIMNDPYEGGMHLPDTYVFWPIFASGKLIAFAIALNHFADCGGRVPGGQGGDSTEIYQEGLRLPPIKVYEGGKPNEAVWAIIDRNVRLPTMIMGDYRALMAACVHGARGLEELVERYGADALEQHFEGLLDYTEALTRAEIAALPDGTYEFEDCLDHTGAVEESIKVKVKVTIEKDHITFDFDGSAPQVKGAVNSTWASSKSGVYYALRFVLRGDIPVNAGFFRSVTVKLPEASIINAALPSPVALRSHAVMRIGDVVWGALSKAVPDQVFAAPDGSAGQIMLYGQNAAGKRFILYESTMSGWGGRPTKDGVEGICHPAANLANTPVETQEADYPVLIEEYSFAPDTEGPGKYRGGLAITRSYRIGCTEVLFNVSTERQNSRPWGLYGGGAGAPSSWTLTQPDGSENVLEMMKSGIAPKAALLRHTSCGAGGWGNPLERDPEQVRKDVLNEKVSLDRAREVYGAVIRPENLTVDLVETNRLRALRVT